VPDPRAALAAVAEEIARLRSDYLAGLPGQLKELTSLAAGLTGEKTDAQALDRLHRGLHKLAGSGGTFGMKALSDQARLLEQTAKNWVADGSAPADAAKRTAFAADIRALPTVPDDVATPPATEPVYPLPKVSARAIRVWLVDDDVSLGQELAQLMGQFGYEVRLFTRVADVEAASTVDRPDVLILDVMFSDEGINATEAMLVRPLLRALSCPLLFISADGNFGSRVRAARAGAAGFLLKPVDVPRLVERIERIFDDRQAAPYRVMIVDDDVVLAEHYRLVLTGAGIEVEVLNQPGLVIERAAAFRPELMLMDMHMPDYAGPELATVIRQHEEWLSMPIVYLSSETDLDRQIEALGRGADDFLSKPISDARLTATVRVRVSRSRQLADLVAKDSLTGLLKHSRIKEEIATELARSRRNGKPMSVVMVDIDHFKRVNDTYGHAPGDRVIKAVAHLLKQRLRKTDGIGRYGGEEFAIALPECDATMARGIMEDICRRFAALRFVHAGSEFSCTLSAGIATSNAGDDEGGTALLAFADKALYLAKNGGRNRVCVSGDEK
jgi:diguanylate cyclase (GGDEF)-like protein